MTTSLLIRDDTIREALREVIDPELGESLVELGLIYGIRVDGGRVDVDLTLTAPSCPLHASLLAAAERAIRLMVPGVEADKPRRQTPPGLQVRKTGHDQHRCRAHSR